jgi:hypothetical protein
MSTDTPSTPPRKAILNIGLGDSTTQTPTGDPSVVATLESQWSIAEKHGFDFTVVYIDPANPTPAFEALSRKFREREDKWDGIVVGGGIRLNPEHTGLLEQIMGAVVSETWGKGGRPMFAFPGRPNDIVFSLKRVFPENFGLMKDGTIP